MSACCRIGALLGALPPEQTEALTRYGLDIGIAFQISDDALDFDADQDRLGKAIGADLREGKRTLPLIAMLERVPPLEAERVRALLRRRTLETAEIEDIRRLVLEARRCGVRARPRAGLRPGGQGRSRGVRAVRGAGDAVAGGGLRRGSRSVSVATPPRVWPASSR